MKRWKRCLLGLPLVPIRIVSCFFLAHCYGDDDYQIYTFFGILAVLYDLGFLYSVKSEDRLQGYVEWRIGLLFFRLIIFVYQVAMLIVIYALQDGFKNNTYEILTLTTTGLDLLVTAALFIFPKPLLLDPRFWALAYDCWFTTRNAPATNENRSRSRSLRVPIYHRQTNTLTILQNVDSLPQIDVSTISGQEQCCICMDRRVNRATPCLHRFCDKCLDMLFSQPTGWGHCPICRQKITRQNIFAITSMPSSQNQVILESMSTHL